MSRRARSVILRQGVTTLARSLQHSRFCVGVPISHRLLRMLRTKQCHPQAQHLPQLPLARFLIARWALMDRSPVGVLITTSLACNRVVASSQTLQLGLASRRSLRAITTHVHSMELDQSSVGVRTGLGRRHHREVPAFNRFRLVARIPVQWIQPVRSCVGGRTPMAGPRHRRELVTKCSQPRTLTPVRLMA